MKANRVEAPAHISSKIDIIEVEVAGRPMRGFVLSHQWRKRDQGTTGSTVPVVLSRESLEGLVQYLQQALQTAATVSSRPKGVQ